MNDEIKTLTKIKNWLYKRQKKSGNLDHTTLSVTTDASNGFNSSKLKYKDRLPKIFNGPRTAIKTCWSILNW